MSEAGFVHLHVHTQYSMLQSAVRLEGLIEKTKAEGMPAVAMTDDGNMFGAVQFHRACQANDIKPILGCEVSVCEDRKKQQRQPTAHLVLLARSQQGYRNLVRIVSLGWVEGMFQGKPRVDFELLRAYGKDVVALSGCLGGYLAQEVLHKGEQAGNAALERLRDCFAPDALFVELQQHGFIEQEPLNEILVSLARAHGLPLIATNDCHFLERKQAYAQLVLRCIATSVPIEEMQKGHHGSEQMYLKSAAEMAEVFRDLPEALGNTLRVAEMCGGAADPLAAPMLPRFSVPEGMTEDSYLRQLARAGLERRFGELAKLGKHVDEQRYRERVEHECDVICGMGYAGYFLIVQDFIQWARRKGIPVGPGRGSGAGSLAAYALGITGLDPLPYGLLFERFLNPERVSMPDFDLDFCMERRDEVIEYVREKFGHDSVGQIATFHLLKSRSVVRDVGRVMKLTAQEAGRIATLIPEPVQGKSVPIGAALEQEPRLKAAYDEDETTRTLLDTARELENLNRHAGMHAAGVVISEGPLWDHVPVFCPEPGYFVTQYDKDDVEAAGLVKFDFLGLKTLTVIDIASRLINKRPDHQGDPFDIEQIPLDDAATYALLQSGETTNVFQLESSGMQNLMKQLRPDRFEDIIQLGALYRPGPLGSGMVEDFVQRKHGRVRVEYPHPCLEETLKETYGVIVYQEQVMRAAREMAGYSLGGADLLRRAMGKKKAQEMAAQKTRFINGAVERGHSAEDATRIFELIDFFSGYGFNKSHAAAYALISYQCAYLKTHYPVEFLCATMTADRDKSEKVVRTVGEARSMGVTVLPPDVNESAIDFTVVYKPDAAIGRPPDKPVAHRGRIRDPMSPKIRFGLGAVKGIGTAALEAIFEARSRPEDAIDGAAEGAESTGERHPFADLFDFTARVDLRRVNKSVIEALVQCGAMDSMHNPQGVGRDRAMAAIERAIERGRKLSADRESGQTDLFGMLESPSFERATAPSPAAFPEVEPWDRADLLAREKRCLGFYISGHPLDAFESELKRFCNASAARLTSAPESAQVSMGGLVENYRERNTRAGGKIAFFELEDPTGRVEVIVRGKALEAHRELLQRDVPLLVTGQVQFERDRLSSSAEGQDVETPTPKLLLDDVAPLVDSFRARTRSVRVRLHVDHVDRAKLIAVRDTLLQFPGKCAVSFELWSSRAWTVTMRPPQLAVEPCDAMMARLERLFGEKICELR